MTKNLVLAGNFNLTNVDELFERLIDLGQYPTETSDTTNDSLKRSDISSMKRMNPFTGNSKTGPAQPRDLRRDRQKPGRPEDPLGTPPSRGMGDMSSPAFSGTETAS
ncbi:MAG: hypothetical protein MZU84_06525 [Sphingobacterium sp.]|nr:hypothetical protein [Sphingobacterium sp.]